MTSPRRSRSPRSRSPRSPPRRQSRRRTPQAPRRSRGRSRVRTVSSPIRRHLTFDNIVYTNLEAQVHTPNHRRRSPRKSSLKSARRLF